MMEMENSVISFYVIRVHIVKISFGTHLHGENQGDQTQAERVSIDEAENGPHCIIGWMLGHGHHDCCRSPTSNRRSVKWNHGALHLEQYRTSLQRWRSFRLYIQM